MESHWLVFLGLWKGIWGRKLKGISRQPVKRLFAGVPIAHLKEEVVAYLTGEIATSMSSLRRTPESQSQPGTSQTQARSIYIGLLLFKGTVLSGICIQLDRRMKQGLQKVWSLEYSALINRINAFMEETEGSVIAPFFLSVFQPCETAATDEPSWRQGANLTR